MSKKNEKFVELANKRVTKTLNHMRLVGNLSNKNSYDYTDEEVAQIIKALEAGVAECKKRFHTQRNKNSNFSISQ